MKTVTIEGASGRSTVMVGERLKRLKHHLPPGKTVVITDERVAELYRSRFATLPCIVIGRGEKVKTLETVAHIYDALIDLAADRSTFVVGIGGGVVCDITGFAASTYMRGLPFGYVATTLLAQVDASVGGKTGVNIKGYKNMAGVFNQPRFVICDPALLPTLPKEEIANGLAEIVKHAAIEDENMFRLLETHAEEALDLEPAIIERLVRDSVRIKARIVNLDEKESGERRKLNFGHTFGHAIERTTGWAHGASISAGMAMAAWVSHRTGCLSTAANDRLLNLLLRLKLPIRVDVQPATLFEALNKDKKRQQDRIHFVLLERIGKAVVSPMRLDALQRSLETISTSAFSGTRFADEG